MKDNERKKVTGWFEKERENKKREREIINQWVS